MRQTMSAKLTLGFVGLGIMGAPMAGQLIKATDGKKTPEFLSTHPSGETRIEQLTALMPAIEPLYQASNKGNAKR
jgi:predicted Zn-dependent protease